MTALELVSRSEWGALAPRHAIGLNTPTDELWLHHTASDEHGAKAVRAIQRYHMDQRGYSDIAYSFIVDGSDGTVYVGRGAHVQGAATKGHNDRSHAIAVTGNFQTYAVKDEVVRAIAALVRYGAGRGWWGRRLSGGHRDVGDTVCPGDRLYVKIPDINALALKEEDDMTDADRAWLREEFQTLHGRLDEANRRLGDIEKDTDGIKHTIPENLRDELDEIRRAVRS